MKRFGWMICSVALLAVACGGPTEDAEQPETMTKEEARTASADGKGDHVDWCEIFDWYGDGICDDWCQRPDPDCAPDTCATDADCADGYCEHYASCLAVDCPPPPPSQCVTADCDDGSRLHPLCDIVPACEDDQVAAVINGCFECRDARTCEAPAPSCDDGSQVSPYCDIRETCADGLVSVVQNGCFVCVDPDTCEPPDATGDFCGGIAGFQCPDGYTCQMAEGTCNIADNAGTCQPTPEACIEIYAPVCGCDGQTYSNDCHALAAGVTVDHQGECSSGGGGDSCGGIAGFTCAEGQYCDYAEGDMCGAADQMGTCRVMPEACTLEYIPVCGCDGQTYSNSCFAAAAGVSVFAEGACE